MTSSTRPGVVLGICCTSIFVVALDSCVVTVALPSLGRDLGSGAAGISWVVDAYTLTLASLLISSGVLADRIGRRRCFRLGLAAFALGSALCALAVNTPFLIGARVVQGLGGSMLLPVALAIIGSVYPEAGARARAMGVWGTVLGIAMAAGPIVGAVLVEASGWRSIFWVNVPICAVALVAAVCIPESVGTRRTIDAGGQAVAVLAMVLLVLGIIEVGRVGPRSGVFWVVATAFVVAAAAAVALARRSRHPFVDATYFRSLPFSVSNVCALAVSGAQGLCFFALSLVLQSHLGHSPTSVGLSLIPAAVGTFALSSASGRAVARFGVAPPLALGGLSVAVSGAILLALGADDTVAVLAAVFCFGAGFGLANAPITSTAVAGMGADAGAASGVVSSSRQLGVSIGVAFAGAVGAPALGQATPSWIALLLCGVVVVGGAALLRAGPATRRPVDGVRVPDAVRPGLTPPS